MRWPFRRKDATPASDVAASPAVSGAVPEGPPRRAVPGGPAGPRAGRDGRGGVVVRGPRGPGGAVPGTRVAPVRAGMVAAGRYLGGGSRHGVGRAATTRPGPDDAATGTRAAGAT